jgi:outer membrane protein OmpA-like peptidoglycan-associated protein
MDTPYGKPAQSVRRFSFLKWGVAGALLGVLLIFWSAGKEPATEATGNVASGRIAPADGGSPTPASLAVEVGPDGAVKVQGVVADEATRNRWLNEIRIGAQGARVVDELRVDGKSPAVASGWGGQLSSLIALMRERRVEGLRVEGNSVLLRGVARSAADKQETDKTIQAQLPSGYRLESRVSVGTVASGATGSAGSAGGQGGGSSMGAGAAGSTPAAPSASVPAKPPAQKQERVPGWPEPSQASRVEDRKADRAPAAVKPDNSSAENRAGAEKSAPAGRPSTEGAGKGTPSKAGNCPADLRSLARPVYFRTDVATVAAQDRARLQRLGECLGRSRVRIVGHADPRLNNDHNQDLSERRARAVADAVRAGGVPASRISVQGAGSSRRSANPSREAMQRSRRVDIQIR